MTRAERAYPLKPNGTQNAEQKPKPNRWGRTAQRILFGVYILLAFGANLAAGIAIGRSDVLS